MKTKGFLIVSKNGSIRAGKQIRADIDPDSVVIGLDIQIPDSAFKPLIQAEIKIDEKDVNPLFIKAGKLNQIQEKISEQIGLNVVLKSITKDLKKA